MEKNYGEEKINNKVLVDMSPFFVFEAAGDSEGDFDHQNKMMMMIMMDGLNATHDDDHDDDAQSCSHEYDDACDGIGAEGLLCRGSHIVHHDNHHHGDDDDDDDDDDDKVISCSRDHDKHITSEVMSTANSHRSRNSCVDSSDEENKMSEKERSRLFWETCLAS